MCYTLQKLLDKIQTPEELNSWMNENIKYGYEDKYNNKIRITYTDRIKYPTYGMDFYKKYKLLSPKEVFNYKFGLCWDQAEFIRFFFKNKFKYPYGVLFYIDITPPRYLAHTVIIYKKDKKVYWFENVLQNDNGSYKGIHEINSLNDIFSKDIKKNKNNIRYGWIPEQSFHVNGVDYVLKNINYFNKFNILGKDKQGIIDMYYFVSSFINARYDLNE